MKKEQVFLDPEWLAKTAKTAMKRGTAIIFSKDSVYGILPKGGGSVNVVYPGDGDWVAHVLSVFPDGAVFPSGNVLGGAATAKALRAYANVKLIPGKSKAWIDPVTHALHVKGDGMTVHSATVGESASLCPKLPSEIEAMTFDEVPKDILKLLVDHTRRDDSRVFLKRVYAYKTDKGTFLGSSDSRGAILHRCPDLPDGFSVDPTLVNPSDIVGYRLDTGKEGISTHYYRLSDGSVFVERMANAVPPPVVQAIALAHKSPRITLLTASALLKLVEDVNALGLGGNDSFGGIVRFGEGKATLKVLERPVAEFECPCQIDEDREIAYALSILSRLARLGSDLEMVDAEKNMAYCVTKETAMAAMPIVIAKPAETT